MTGLRRARSPEDKEQRRQDILDHAWALVQARPWAEITMSDVAEASGLSKAALYRYFETKETLFLEVEAVRLGSWLHELGGQLEAALGSLRPGTGLGAALQLHALCIGLWQMADAGPVVKRLLERPELRPLRIDFRAALVTGSATMLHGLIRAQHKPEDTSARRRA